MSLSSHSWFVPFLVVVIVVQALLLLWLKSPAAPCLLMNNNGGGSTIEITNDNNKLLNNQSHWETPYPPNTYRESTIEITKDNNTLNNESHWEGCTVLLSTFPNSGTTVTLKIFSKATNIYPEAIYKEGPRTPWGTYVTTMSDGLRFPNASLGECRFVKSHGRTLYHQLPSKYQRVVVLSRSREDNYHSNLRYLIQEDRKKKIQLKKFNCTMETLEDWEVADKSGFDRFRDMHDLAHKRWHCHAQQYSHYVPTLIKTYTQILMEPQKTFEDIMLFLGYPNANVTKALRENPIVPHNESSSSSLLGNKLQYIPVQEEDCKNLTKLDSEWQTLFQSSSRCTKAFAVILQYTK